MPQVDSNNRTSVGALALTDALPTHSIPRATTSRPLSRAVLRRVTDATEAATGAARSTERLAQDLEESLSPLPYNRERLSTLTLESTCEEAAFIVISAMEAVEAANVAVTAARQLLEAAVEASRGQHIPAPAIRTSVPMAEVIECALIVNEVLILDTYLEQYHTLVMVDPLTGWYEAKVLQHGDTEEVLQSIRSQWIATYGPPKEVRLFDIKYTLLIPHNWNSQDTTYINLDYPRQTKTTERRAARIYRIIDTCYARHNDTYYNYVLYLNRCLRISTCAGNALRLVGTYTYGADHPDSEAEDCLIFTEVSYYPQSALDYPPNPIDPDNDSNIEGYDY